VPDLGSLLGALPIGLIFFGGMVIGMKRRKLAFHSARTAYPALAAKLGLGHVAPVRSEMIGKLVGEIDGYSVVVDPDDQMRVSVRFPRRLPIVLRSYERTRLPPAGMERLDTGCRRLDALFKERYAAPELAEALYDDIDAWASALRPFEGDAANRLKDFAVTEDGAFCAYDYGKPAHLPARLVEAVVPALVGLGRLLDGAGRRASSARTCPHETSARGIVGAAP
jgi:hypothetical protein